jgi:GNAT superfamily N-acetyltransferase
MHHHDAAGAQEIRAELLALYAQVYADRLADPFYSVPRFGDRFDSHCSAPGFELVTAGADGELRGYVYGFGLIPESGWFFDLRDTLPAGLASALRRGDVFAVCEVMVHPAWQRQGIGSGLHRALRRSRPESVFTLLIEEGNTPSEVAHASWGYRPIGAIRPFPELPTYMVMASGPADAG